MITASGKVVTALSTAIPVAHNLGQRWQNRYPQFDTAQLLAGDIGIPAQSCTERTAFASKIKGAHVVTVMLPAPQQVVNQNAGNSQVPTIR